MFIPIFIGKGRKSILDGIPKTLPSLQKAQKILARTQERGEDLKPKDREEELALRLLEIAALANEAKIDLECALQKILRKKERDFRVSELQ